MSDEPIVAQAGPYQVELVEGRLTGIAVADGRSRSRSATARTARPISSRWSSVAPSTGTFNLCGCKATDDEPWCDGSHNMI